MISPSLKFECLDCGRIKLMRGISRFVENPICMRCQGNMVVKELTFIRISNEGEIYDHILKRLKVLDEKQLIELFHDIEDVNTVERIACAAYEFVENYVDPKDL